jgi:hypothetical protein
MKYLNLTVPRGGLFVPATRWPEFAALITSGVSTRAVGLWGTIRMQAAVERKEWVRVRTHLKRSLGIATDTAYWRVVKELERAGFIEVERRPGYASLVRLVPRPAGEGDGDG